MLMTKTLHRYFTPRARKKARLTVIPMTVEPERFMQCADTIAEAGRYIAYCGDMTGIKDGVPILVDAFRLIAEKHPDVKLYLIGDARRGDLERLQQKVAEYGLRNRVVFTGPVSRDRMPAYLCSASLLALARPDSLQAQGGFPTKLGEYLATGKPVVVTAVGEIPDYLTDGVHAFVAEPGSAEKFAEKLNEALSHPARAAEAGLAGRELTRTVFNYRVQADQIIAFIKSL